MNRWCGRYGENLRVRRLVFPEATAPRLRAEQGPLPHARQRQSNAISCDDHRAASEDEERSRPSGNLLKKVKAAAFSEREQKESEDPGSKDKGGESRLGRQGQTVPEFEKDLFG